MNLKRFLTLTKNEKDESRDNRRIKAVIDAMFDDIPYSPESSEAQGKIETALCDKYSELCQDKPEGEAFDELLAKYGQLAQMAALAGYSEEQVKSWRSAGNALELKSTRKMLWKQRRFSYAASLFATFGLINIIWIIYDAINLKVEFFFNLLLMGLNVFLSVWFVRKILRNEKSLEGKKYDNAAFAYLRSRSDQYTKRWFNSIAILFGAGFLFFGSGISILLSGNSKQAELMEYFMSNIITVEIPLFLLGKNVLLHKVIMRRIHLPDEKKSNNYGIWSFAISLVYWVVVTLFAIFARGSLTYPGNVFPVALIIYGLLVLVANLTLRKKITFQNIAFNGKRVTAAVTAAALALGVSFMQRDTWYTQRYINATPVVEHNTHRIDYNDSTGVYTITSSTKDFKILHLTDIHIGGSLYSYANDIKALEACYKEIEHTHPDLVVVTGDMCFPMGIMSLSLNNAAPVQQFAAFMRNTGIPWAFTYGNHDTESMSTLNSTELNEVYKSLSFKTSGNLLYPYTQPDIMGRNNQVIEIRNTDGSLNTALFMIDSNAYTGEGINVYDYIHDDQVDWYASEVKRLNEEAGHTVNSLVFFHIPLQEYKTATELYLADSDEVKYYFGENPGDHGGITNELVCCSDYPSKLFDTAVALGSSTGFFCGHDHYNNASIEYKGIRLTYGMSIDYLAMPGIAKETTQRGAELITIHSDSTWDLEQIPLTSLE